MAHAPAGDRGPLPPPPLLHDKSLDLAFLRAVLSGSALRAHSLPGHPGWASSLAAASTGTIAPTAAAGAAAAAPAGPSQLLRPRHHQQQGPLPQPQAVTLGAAASGGDAEAWLESLGQAAVLRMHALTAPPPQLANLDHPHDDASMVGSGAGTEDATESTSSSSSSSATSSSDGVDEAISPELPYNPAAQGGPAAAPAQQGWRHPAGLRHPHRSPRLHRHRHHHPHQHHGQQVAVQQQYRQQPQQEPTGPSAAELNLVHFLQAYQSRLRKTWPEAPFPSLLSPAPVQQPPAGPRPMPVGLGYYPQQQQQLSPAVPAPAPPLWHAAYSGAGAQPPARPLPLEQQLAQPRQEQREQQQQQQRSSSLAALLQLLAQVRSGAQEARGTSPAPSAEAHQLPQPQLINRQQHLQQSRPQHAASHHGSGPAAAPPLQPPPPAYQQPCSPFDLPSCEPTPPLAYWLTARAGGGPPSTSPRQPSTGSPAGLGSKRAAADGAPFPCPAHQLSGLAAWPQGQGQRESDSMERVSSKRARTSFGGSGSRGGTPVSFPGALPAQQQQQEEEASLPRHRLSEGGTWRGDGTAWGSGPLPVPQPPARQAPATGLGWELPQQGSWGEQQQLYPASYPPGSEFLR